MKKGPHFARILVLILLLATVVLGIMSIVRTLRHGAAVTAATPILLPVSSDSRSAVVGEGIITFDGQKLTYLNSAGRSQWSRVLDSPSARIAVSETMTVVYTDSQLHAFNSKGELTYSDRVTETIQEVRCGKTRIAVLTQGDVPTVRVLDEQGAFIDAKSFEGYVVLDFGFYEADQLWVMQLDRGSSAPYTIVSTYQPGRLATGQISFTDELVYRSFFLKNEAVFAGTQNITWCEQASNITPKETLLVYGWQCVASGVVAEKTVLLMSPAEESDRATGIETVNVIGQTSGREWRLPLRCPWILARDGMGYGVSESAVLAFPLAGGELKQYDLSIIVDDVVGVTAKGVMFVSSGGSIYSITIA